MGFVPVTTPPSPVGDRTQTERPVAAASPRADSRRLERNRRRDSLLRRLLAAADLSALAIMFALVERGALEPTAALSPLLFVLVLKLSGLYDRDPHVIHKSTLTEVPTLFIATTVFTLFMLAAGELFLVQGLSPAESVGSFGVLFASLIVLRIAARWAWRHMTPAERCLLVGNTTRDAELREALGRPESSNVTLVGVVPIFPSPSNTDATPVSEELLDELEIDRVIFAPGSHGTDELMFVIRELRDAGVKVSVIPDVSRLAGASVEVDVLGGMTLLGMRRFSITRSSRIIKRSFDLVVAALLMIVLAPLLAAIAIAIRLEEPGSPILYRQRRIGTNGRSFNILKFRSMHNGAHAQREALAPLNEGAEGFFKIADDPRITRVGSRIRRHNLDELPQLVNVLRGEMSLVGPRPLIPEEDANIPELYRRRLDVRPGITGHWQVLGSARVPLEEMVKLDYLYVSNWSLWGDLLLLARTLPLLARGRGM